jgi:hypothetical protein
MVQAGKYVDDESLVSRIAALYDPLQSEVIYREGIRPDATDRSFLHEFVHALQDQHFDLNAKLFAADSIDRFMAFRCVIEGHADYHSYKILYGSTSAADIVERRCREYRVQSVTTGLSVMEYGPDMAGPYAYGARFAGRMESNGVSLSLPMADPSLSSEQILHPAKYFVTRDYPTTLLLDLKMQERTLTASTSLGEYLILGLLRNYLPSKEAALAACGWDGDLALIYEDHAHQPFLVWISTWDRPKDAGEFSQAMVKCLERKQLEDAPFDGFDYAYVNEEGSCGIFLVGKEVIVYCGKTFEKPVELAGRIRDSLKKEFRPEDVDRGTRDADSTIQEEESLARTIEEEATRPPLVKAEGNLFTIDDVGMEFALSGAWTVFPCPNRQVQIVNSETQDRIVLAAAIADFDEWAIRSQIAASAGLQTYQVSVTQETILGRKTNGYAYTFKNGSQALSIGLASDYRTLFITFVPHEGEVRDREWVREFCRTLAKKK